MQYIRKLLNFESPTWVEWLIYFGFFTILHIPSIRNFYNNDGPHNAYLLFAQSLEHGHLYLPASSPHEDMISFHNNYFLPYPPLPSLILLPLVAISGSHVVNTVFIVIILSCFNLVLLHKILVKFQVNQQFFIWIITAFFFGSGYWFALFTSHHVYSFAHITSCTFQLLLLNELFGKKRWWLIGIYTGCTFLTRQFTFLYILFVLGYMIYLHREKKENIKLTSFIALFIPIVFFIGAYMIYNYERFGNPLDSGYSYILFNGVLKERVNTYGLFNIKYFFFNLYSYFIKGFNIEFQGNGLLHIKDMDLWGTSLLSASPFFIASIRARWHWILIIAGWLTIGSILTGALFYHNNGFHQINTMRFSLDFLPLLFVLTVLGIKDLPRWLWKGMIAYAVFLNLLSFTIHFIYQTK